jgi:hypothetical protein
VSKHWLYSIDLATTIITLIEIANEETFFIRPFSKQSFFYNSLHKFTKILLIFWESLCYYWS